jgi:Arc/MetJ-type ribon-helix-helix transcriptional regulator
MRTPLTLADLPEDAARFAEEQIGAGHFASVDAFVSAATVALQEQLSVLRAAIDEGDSSGVAVGDSFARVRAQLGLTSR